MKADAWIREHVVPTGEPELAHERPWASVWRVPTADGPVWFKANTESLRYEAALVEVLAEERPDGVPALLAVDRERGWMLMADAGERLREIVGRERPAFPAALAIASRCVGFVPQHPPMIATPSEASSVSVGIRRIF